jgi:2-desacetyl-2-hydroxyethyl bacteriochlorophyllide A dehydrogenase
VSITPPRGTNQLVRFAGPRTVDVVAEAALACPPGHVRVRTHYSGISAGTELSAYRGSNVYLNKGWDTDRRLFVPGEQSVSYPLSGWGYSEVGEVTEIGPTADGGGAGGAPRDEVLAVGDVVYGIWGHRSEAVLPAAALASQIMPKGLDPLLGVFARVGAIALNAVLAADLHITETVVITGQGVIGLLATRLAVLSGARVIAVDRIGNRLATARAFGAIHALNAADGDVAARVRELTGAGADVAIEISGAYPALHEATRCVQPGGRVVAAGFYQGPATGLNLGEEFHHNRVSVVASQIGGLPTALSGHWDKPRLHRAVMELIAAGSVDVSPLLTHLVPAQDADTAYRLLDEDPTGALQVVLDFRDACPEGSSFDGADTSLGPAASVAVPALHPRSVPDGVLTMAARAAYVLRGNSGKGMTKAAPDLYPHQWSWDAAFVAAGLAHVDVARACTELDGLFAGQWRTGMLPHIVFDPDESNYFPGPQRWDCQSLSIDAPSDPQTSGICQPPVHALATQRIVAIAEGRGGQAAAAVAAWLPGAYTKLLAWHRYLATHRDPDGDGVLTIYHGWESGMDNSPRWDAVYARVSVPDTLPPYQRRDTTVVTDQTQRPTQAEYDRYLWIVEELKQAGYDDARIRATASFLTTDVFMSAIFAAANDALADLAELVGASESDELRQYAARFRRGVAATVDHETGLATDRDLRTGRALPAETIAGFAPLLCGGLDDSAEARLLALLESSRWTGHPGLRHATIPTTSPMSPAFRPRAYWRGPSWPVMNWLFAWTLHHRGHVEAASRIRGAALAELGDGSLAEYYEPLTGEPLGSRDQSWTAAAALDLLLSDEWTG